jgi:hypothetical protein
MGDATMTGRDDGLSRRKVLECMTWAGTGVLWTVAGGVPTSLGIIDGAVAAQQKGFTFLQISDSHMGFDKPANPYAKGTLEEAIARVKALQVKPSFMIHTGDISHLSKPSEFDDADRISLSRASTCTTCPANTTYSTKSKANSTATVTDVAPKAPAGTALTLMACTLSAWSMLSI